MYPARPAEFAYHRPTSIAEALGLLAGLEESRPLAGGHSLLPAMKLRLSMPAALVDLGRIPGLDGITLVGDGVRIGALATHASVAASEAVRSACPMLAETAARIGDRQVHNRGTIGGSLAHADPGADYPTAVTALGATVTAVSSHGEREIAATDFFAGAFTTALAPGELITSVRVPVTGAGSGAVYVKHRHPASSFAVVGVAAAVSVEAGACTHARLVVGGATGSPVEAKDAVAGLVGSQFSEEAVAAAAARVPAALEDAFGDVYASADYRRHLAGVLARQALSSAFARAS